MFLKEKKEETPAVVDEFNNRATMKTEFNYSVTMNTKAPLYQSNVKRTSQDSDLERVTDS